MLCISKEVFEKLKAALNKFGPRPKKTSPKLKPSFQQKPLERKPAGGHRNGNLKPIREDKSIGSFEPSNIFNIQASSLWRLRRLKTWFKEQESYEDLRYLELYKIEI